MNTKNPSKDDDPKSIIELIIIAGVILDSYSVYGFWKSLHDDKYIGDVLQKNGLNGSDLGLEQIISTFQNGLSLVLLVFLLFDFFAYFHLSQYKNWARKYVLSIAVFYLIGCLFDFSLIYFSYSIFTIYYLYNAPKEFF